MQPQRPHQTFDNRRWQGNETQEKLPSLKELIPEYSEYDPRIRPLQANLDSSLPLASLKELASGTSVNSTFSSVWSNATSPTSTTYNNSLSSHSENQQALVNSTQFPSRSFGQTSPNSQHNSYLPNQQLGTSASSTGTPNSMTETITLNQSHGIQQMYKSQETRTLPQIYSQSQDINNSRFPQRQHSPIANYELNNVMSYPGNNPRQAQFDAISNQSVSPVPSILPTLTRSRLSNHLSQAQILGQSEKAHHEIVSQGPFQQPKRSFSQQSFHNSPPTPLSPNSYVLENARLKNDLNEPDAGHLDVFGPNRVSPLQSDVNNSDFSSQNRIGSTSALTEGSGNISSTISHALEDSQQQPKKRRGNLPKPVTDVLRKWLTQHIQHPYPTEAEKLELMQQTGLTLNQISNWFINARRRRVPSMTKENGKSV